MKNKNIYITWHYTTHGIAYFKHILSAFHNNGLSSNDLIIEELNQEELNDYFDSPKKDGFKFDEIIYLTAPQEAFDKLSARRFEYKDSIIKDEQVEGFKLGEVFKEIIENKDICYQLDKELDYVRKKYQKKIKNFEKVIWRNIQHYPVIEQIKWLNEKSNYTKAYPPLTSVELDIIDLRDEKLVADKLSEWLRDFISKQKDLFNLVINVSLGSNETQVVWHILAESDRLPNNTRFIKTHDAKNKKVGNRFKDFSIKETPIKLISDLVENISFYPETKSPKRLIVDKKLKTFVESGFAILLIGERGIGKSQMARRAKQNLEESKNNKKSEVNIIEANCASFTDDIMAESQLFGYKKGAFTGASEDTKGLIQSAENGILFLDEIHHLSKNVQARLMKALQTNEKNELSIRRLGDSGETKVKDVRLIFATNKNVKELREILLPDFYDRIVQHVIEIPPLRDTIEDRVEDWKKVWEGLKFKGNPKVPNESNLIKWIRGLPLYGNFRDLQKIAMYYNAFNSFDDETRKLINEKTAFQYAKNEFEKYHSSIVQLENEKYNFNIEQTTKEMIADYLFELQDWAVKKFKGRKSAIEHFKSKGDTITEKTFNNWKNKKL